MPFIGADTDQLDDLGGALQDGRGRLEELAGTLSLRVRSVTTTAWHGSDAAAFQERFHTVSRQLDTLAERLQQTGNDVTDQARQQDETSTPTSASASTPNSASASVSTSDSTSGASLFEPGGAYSGQPWWQSTFDVGKGLWDVGQSARGIADGISNLRQWSRNMDEIPELARHLPATAEMFQGDLVDDIIRTVDDNPIPDAARGLQGAADWMGGTFASFGDSAVGRFTNGAIDALNSPALQTVGRIAGPVFSGFEIVDGLGRMTESTSVLDRISGGLSTVSGVTGLAAMFPPAAPIFGTISVATGVASAAIDLGTSVVENWDTISATTGDLVEGAGEAIGDVGDAIGDAIGDGLSSLF